MEKGHILDENLMAILACESAYGSPVLKNIEKTIKTS
jgi:hypothetical protein